MQIALKIPENLRKYCDGHEHLQLEGSSVGDVLADLALRSPRLAERVVDADARLFPHLVVIHNQQVLPRQGVHEVRLAEGDELRILAAAAGG